MPQTDPLEIVVTAQDRASQTLRGVGQQLDIFGQSADNTLRKLDGTTASTERFDSTLRRAGSGVRVLAYPLLAELSPALGTTSSRIASVLAASAIMPNAFTAIAIAATGLAGIVVGKLAASWGEASKSQEAYRRALALGDLAAVTRGVTDQAEEVRNLAAAYREAAEARAGIDPRRERQLQGPLSPGARERRAGAAAAGGIADLGERQRELERLEFNAGYAAAEGDTARIIGQQEQERLDRLKKSGARTTALELSQRGLFDFRLDPIEQRFQQQLREASDLEREGQTTAATRLRGAARVQRSHALGERFATGAPVNPFETIEGQEAERRAREAALVTEEEERSKRAVELGLSRAEGELDLSRVPAIRGTEQDLALAEKRAQAEARDRQAGLAMLDVLHQQAAIVGQLTPELESQLALRERDLLLSQEGLTQQEKQLVNERARLALFAEQAAMNPLAGLAAGFSEVANRSRELGTELRSFAHDTSEAMGRAFSDNFFNLFTGRKGEDIGKQFGESLLRSVTDLLGRQLSGAVSGIFAQALGGARGFNGAVGGGFDLLSLLGGTASGSPILSPTGAPAGSLMMTQGGQLVQVTASGALQLVQGQGGGGGLGFDPSTLTSGASTLYSAYSGVSALAANYAVGGVQGALFGLQGITAGGSTFLVPAGTAGYAAAELGAVGVSTGAGAGTSGLIGQGGALFGSTASAATAGVLAAVALGFTIYGGLTQEATLKNIAINAVSGAVSGAVLGAAIGAIIGNVPGAIIGGVIGAIAGGAAAGGTTGLKAPRKPSTAEISTKIGEAAANNLVGAIRRAASIEDLVTIFNTQWAPHGEVQILTTYEGVVYWAGDADDPPGAAATPQLMIIPEFLDALVIQVGQTGAPQRRQDLENEFRAKRDELLETLSNIPFGILESDRAAGVTRRTYLPFQQLYGLEPGKQQLFGSSQLYRDDLGGEEETIRFLIDRIKEYSVRRDVDISNRDFMFR